MAHVEPLQIDEAPEDARPIMKAIEDKFGQSLNIFSTLAHQPDVLGGVTQINDGVRNDLPDSYRELAYYKASRVNDCDYCSHYHRQAAKETGVTEEQLEAIDHYCESEAFDDREKAVLAYADQLTKTADADEETVKSLKTFLSDSQLVTLAATVALANFTNRFNHGLGVELP